jgi:hypothetical protein
VASATITATAIATPAASRTVPFSPSLNTQFSASDTTGQSELFEETAAFTASQRFIPISGNDASGLSTGVIAAVAISSVVFVVVMIVGSWLVWKHCSPKNGCQRRQTEQSANLESLRLAELNLLDLGAFTLGKRGN